MTQNVGQLIEETMHSYYEYIVKIESGCTVIAKAFETGDIATGVQGIQAFSEGLSWLVEIENLMQLHSYRINSPVGKVIPLFEKINVALEAGDFATVSVLFENKLKPLFQNASEWKFEKAVS